MSTSAWCSNSKVQLRRVSILSFVPLLSRPKGPLRLPLLRRRLPRRERPPGALAEERRRRVEDQQEEAALDSKLMQLQGRRQQEERVRQVVTVIPSKRSILELPLWASILAKLFRRSGSVRPGFSWRGKKLAFDRGYRDSLSTDVGDLSYTWGSLSGVRLE